MNGDNPTLPTLPTLPPIPPELLNLLNAASPDGVWKPTPKVETIAAQPSSNHDSSTPEQIIRRCIEYMPKLEPSIQGFDGSGKLMWAARVVCWGFDLGEEVGYDLLATHFNPRCEPPWSEGEIRKKCRDAVQNPKMRRGWIRDADTQTSYTHTSAGYTVPADLFDTSPFYAAAAAESRSAGQGGTSGDIFGGESAKPPPPTARSTEPPTPPPTTSAIGIEEDDPHRLAKLFLEQFLHNDGCRLRYWAGEFCLWSTGAYSKITEEDLRGRLSCFIETDFMSSHLARVRAHQHNREAGGKEKDKAPTKKRVSRNLVSDVLQAIRGLVAIPATQCPPSWLGDGPPADEIVAARNGLVHLPSHVAGHAEAFTASTPKFFSFNRVSFDFEADAPTPRTWLNFLSQLWPDDPQSVACLQEWFGYLITPDTSRHKMLLIIGPPRAGKGTISRVLKALVGELNVAAPTLGKMAEQFGLQDLIGKPVAMIGDARLSGRTDAVAITEELLSISGEDDRTIPRKHTHSLTMKLPTRFVFLSNEMPQLGDSSGALLGRMVILRLTRSFLGCEDLTLLEKLLVELPGILLWAAAGWARLREQGQFTNPDSAADLRDEAEAVTSPMRCFIRERIELCDDDFVSTRTLYAAWVEWCKKRGRENIDHQERFVARLRAAMPDIRAYRCRSGSNRERGYIGLRLMSEYETGELFT